MNEQVEGAKSAIEAAEPPSIAQIPFNLLDRANKKTTKLLANSGDAAPLDGRNRKYRYVFKEPVFVSHVVIESNGYKDYDRFVWQVINEFGSESSFNAYPKDGEIIVSIDEFCKEVSFEPPSAWLRTTILNEVQIYGFQKAETSQFIDFAYSIDEQKSVALEEISQFERQAQARIAAAEAKEAELASVDDQISAKKSELRDLERQAKEEASKLSEITSRSGAASKQLEGVEERIANLRSEIKIQTQVRDNLGKEVVNSQNNLASLRANINLFPSEISGFVDQASRNTSQYLNYAFGPIFIMCSMFLLLISGAVDLTTVVTNNPNVNLAAIIVSRMPYVAVASAIIYASYRLARLFITEVMNINRQRLSLTKVSIIAKDVSQAAEEDLNLGSEAIYTNRLKVKMALLGDHIKHLINTEPELLFPENLFAMPKSKITRKIPVGRKKQPAASPESGPGDSADS